MTEPIRVVMMGTPDFAVPTLHALHAAAGVAVVAVVTQPDRPVGRKQIPMASPLKQAAAQLGLPVLQPERVRHPEALEQIAAFRPDVLVTAAFGQILPQRLLDLAPYGCLNVHASLLPRWRGAAPIHRAIMAGDAETGVTIMRTVRELDAGPILGVRRRPIAADDDVGRVHDDLARMGAQLLCELLPVYVAGALQPTPQPVDGVTYAERVTRADEWIDWTRSTFEVHNHIRGLSPWPGATTRFEGEDMKVWASLPPSEGGAKRSEVAQPGAIRPSDGDTVWVRCGDGWLGISSVQPAGRRRMPAGDWARGQRRAELAFAPAIVP
ncbi:MAG: methionyl-tRNA formyltransferase [Alicyclobacillus sp.]|nr:methionyl-tRNA formyltransferase [Alicyclobacillus sp.]